MRARGYKRTIVLIDKTVETGRLRVPSPKLTEASAYYTDNLQDAVATMRFMFDDLDAGYKVRMVFQNVKSN
jgi:hypothetical protein